MKNQDDHFSIPHHATNNLFLRFLANNIFSPISSFFLHLYLKWGTTYEFDYIGFKEQNKEILDRLGSDYDESGIPYWKKTGKVGLDYDPKFIDGSVIPETDAMGREKFWEDLGRAEDGK